MTNGEPLAPATRIGRVGLRVADLSATVPFYRDVVGLAIHEEAADRVTLGSPERPLLELIEAPDAPERSPGQAGLYHVAIRVPTRGALGAAVERIEAEWQLDGTADHAVSEAIYLRDPAGNGLELYRDRPRSSWPIDDGRVGMVTDPLALEEVRRAAESDATVDPAVVPVGTDVGHVHLEVPDLAAARAFYVDGLGMAVRATVGEAALFVAAGEYHHHVGLNAWRHPSEPAAADALGLAWYELQVPDAGELRRVVDRLTASGVEVGGDDETLSVVDPAGNRLRLVPVEGVTELGRPDTERSE